MKEECGKGGKYGITHRTFSRPFILVFECPIGSIRRKVEKLYTCLPDFTGRSVEVKFLSAHVKYKRKFSIIGFARAYFPTGCSRSRYRAFQYGTVEVL
jgi:hypothetical protein